ncbi:MAG: alanine dehydrogenase [Deltaproteobacteria bacterium RIFOXYD12_FULL_57_12]|nr:MAG: alanine dehydrogenase [Deltaproteobacteria bacterium RIFOXYD12_FULL_57_12]
MIIGIPKEIKDREYRVGIVPAGVKTLANSGHTILVETGAGLGSDITDAEYERAGARIVAAAAAAYQADLVMKVKEPQPAEYPLLRENLILYTYLHLAPLPELTAILMEKKVSAIGYETVRLDNGYLPLLAPMSEVAGRMAIQVGAHFLAKENGGRGLLLGGVPGVEHGHVTIIGGGTVGSNAARVATALGATVTVLDTDLHRLAYLEDIFAGRITTLMSNQHNIEAELARADLVVGAVLIPGSSAPCLVCRDMLKLMKKGVVIVDVAIDQGGCIETSRPTTHSKPIFEIDGIIHYCVTNMPGAVPRTSTFALTNVTLPLAQAVADQGLKKAALANPALRRGINVYQGKITNKEVAVSQGRNWEEYRQ